MNSTFNNISFDNQMDLYNSLSPAKVSQASPALPTSSLSPSKTPPENFVCGGCKNVIKDKYMLEGNNQYWHEDCLQVCFFLYSYIIYILNFFTYFIVCLLSLSFGRSW